MEKYLVQAQLGDKFEDLLIEAASPEQAVELAREQTTLRHRFTNFVL